MPIDKWQKVIDVNLTGAFLFAQAAGRELLDHLDLVLGLAEPSPVVGQPHRTADPRRLAAATALLLSVPALAGCQELTDIGLAAAESAAKSEQGQAAKADLDMIADAGFRVLVPALTVLVVGTGKGTDRALTVAARSPSMLIAVPG